MQEVWIAQIYDYYNGATIFVGVFSEESKGHDAIDIILKRAREMRPDMCPEGRFDWSVSTIAVDSFAEEPFWGMC